jgi:hypothetical protein
VKTQLLIEVSNVISMFKRSHDAFYSGVIILATILQSTNDYNDNNLKVFCKTNVTGKRAARVSERRTTSKHLHVHHIKAIQTITLPSKITYYAKKFS